MMNNRGTSLCALLSAVILALSWLTVTMGAGAFGQTAASTDHQEPFEAIRRRGFDAFYNLEYETSEKLFEQLIERRPEHPAGHLYMATQVWLTELHRSRRLQTDLYSSSSFYSKTAETIDPQVDRRFRDYIQRAIEKAEAWLEKDDQDVEARYFLGAAFAVLAGYEGSVARAFFAALKHGRRAVEEHRKVIKQDPNFADAYLTIGIYDYVVGSLPTWVKVLAAIGGIRGSTERGIEEIQRAAGKGKYTRHDARVVLITIHARERQYPKALDLVRELSERYPHNYLLPIEEANLLVKMGRKREGFDAFESMLQDERFQDVHDLIRFQYAQTLRAQGYRVAALHHYRKVISAPNANPQLVSLAHLHIGQLLDLQGDRQAAIAHYNIVLGRDNAFDSHERAQKYLQKPFTGDT